MPNDGRSQFFMKSSLSTFWLDRINNIVKSRWNSQTLKYSIWSRWKKKQTEETHKKRYTCRSPAYNLYVWIQIYKNKYRARRHETAKQTPQMNAGHAPRRWPPLGRVRRRDDPHGITRNGSGRVFFFLRPFFTDIGCNELEREKCARSQRLV